MNPDGQSEPLQANELKLVSTALQSGRSYKRATIRMLRRTRADMTGRFLPRDHHGSVFQGRKHLGKSQLTNCSPDSTGETETLVHNAR